MKKLTKKLLTSSVFLAAYLLFNLPQIYAQNYVVEIVLVKAYFNLYTGEGDDDSHGPRISVMNNNCLKFTSSAIQGAVQGQTGTIDNINSSYTTYRNSYTFSIQLHTHEERSTNTDDCGVNRGYYNWRKDDRFDVTTSHAIDLRDYPQGVLSDLKDFARMSSDNGTYVNLYFKIRYKPVPLKVSEPPSSPCPNKEITLRATNEDSYSAITNTTGLSYKWQYHTPEDVVEEQDPVCVQNCQYLLQDDYGNNYGNDYGNDYWNNYWNNYQRYENCLSNCQMLETITWHDLATTGAPSYKFTPVNSILSNRDLSTEDTRVFFRVKGTSGIEGPDGQKSRAFIFQKYKTPVGLSQGQVLSPTCKGGDDGSIEVIPRGIAGELCNIDIQPLSSGVSQPGQEQAANLSKTFNNLPSGEYRIFSKRKVSPSGSMACSMDSIEVSIPPGPRTLLSATYSSSPILCSGGTSLVSVHVVGGNGAYSFSRVDADYQPPNVFNYNFPSGRHSIYVKDGCLDPNKYTIDNFLITAPAPITINSVTPSYCNSSNDATLTVSASGGTGDLRHSLYKNGVGVYAPQEDVWVGNHAKKFTGLSPGTYEVRVSDSNSCGPFTQTVTIPFPLSFSSSSFSVTDPSCRNPAAELGRLSENPAVSGGTPFLKNPDGSVAAAPYYKWKVGTGNYVPITTGLEVSPGGYMVTVLDEKGCTVSQQATMNLPIRGTINYTPISCYNGTTNLQVTATGGSGPYSYSWSGNGRSGVTANLESVSGSLTGTQYSVTITDSKGCTSTAATTVRQPALLSLSLSASDFNGKNIRCHNGTDGSLTATASGGTVPYTYTWTEHPEGTLHSEARQDGNSTIENLRSREYRVSVTDVKNCPSVYENKTLSQPDAPVTFDLASDSVTCFGNRDGRIIRSNESGGTGAIFYSYNDAISYNNAFVNNILPNLPAGTYSITAADRNSCSTTKSIEVKGPSAALTLAVTAETLPLCNGDKNGQITLTASGGTPPYKYSKDNITFVSTNTFMELLKGEYFFYVKDKRQCWAETGSISLSEPPVLSFITTVRTQSCLQQQDGQITVTAQGGTTNSVWATGYQYSLDQAEFGVSNIFNNLSARSSEPYYKVRVKDKNECVAQKFIEVGIQPALTAIIEQPSDGIIKCKGDQTGKLNLTVTGGTPVYTYNWSNGETTQNLTSLLKGDYSVTVNDSRGCSTTTGRQIAEPSQLVVEGTLSNYHTYNISCAGGSNGSITLNVTGGTPQAGGIYNYLWNDGRVTNRITGLRAVEYSVTVRDANECRVAKQWTLRQADTLKVDIKPASKTHLTCYGDRDGSLLLRTSGGAGDGFFSIDGGVTYQASPDFPQLPEGTYTIRAKDINECVSRADQTVGITQNSELQIVFSERHPAQCGRSNGYIVSLVSGGIAPYSYRWTAKDKEDRKLTNVRLEDVEAGQYPLTITDHVGCTKSSSASVSNWKGPVFSIVDINPTRCSYSRDGSASVSINSAAAPYTIRWSNGESGMTNLHLPCGKDNSVTIIDGNYCETTHEFSIEKPDEISLRSSTLVPPVCHLQSNAQIEVETTGGIGVHHFYWDNNLTEGTRSITGISAGIHSLKIVDANLCEAVFQLPVPDKAEVVVEESFVRHITCFGGTDGSLEVLAGGGNGGFTYLWNTGSTAVLLNGLSMGDYSVIATDSRGCTGRKTITLTSPSQVMAALTKTDNLCRGDSKGQIQVTASGGVPGYQYSINDSKAWNNRTTYNHLADEDYTINVKDNKGCVGRSSIRITSPSALSIEVSNRRNPFCELSDGMAEVNVSGGTTPYHYEWRNSRGQLTGTQPVLSGCAAGGYTLKVTDKNTCPDSLTVSFHLYAKPEFDVINITPESCYETKDASAALQIHSIRAPYTILWSSSKETTIRASKLSRGGTVTVTDNNSCSITKPVSVPYTPEITISNETVEHPRCHGEQGLISLRAIGGTGVKKYFWNETPGKNTITPAAGNYTLSIRDENNCTLTKTYALIDPPVFTIDIGPDQIICPRTTLSAGVSIPEATYKWTGPKGFQSTQGITSLSLSGLYRLEVLSRNGCLASDEMTLTVKEDLLKVDFLMTGKAFVRDTVEIIDISMPIPQEVLWCPDESAKVITRTADHIQVVFPSPGTYSVKMMASLSGCQNSHSQSLLIIDRPYDDRQGGRMAEDTPLSVYPNPFDQLLNVVVKLPGTSEALVEVLSFSHKGLLMSKTLSGEKEYTLAFDFGDYLPGLYVVALRYKDKIFTVKVIKR